MNRARVRMAMVAVLWGVGAAFSPTASGQCCGDVNADHRIDIVDALFVAQYTVGLRPLSCHTPAFPASGQTTSYGPGSDGDVQAGATLSYTDNGDGTITDNNTRLMWEKNDDSGGIHDQDNGYTWGMIEERAG